MKVVVIFDRFGPYHVARLKAAANYMNIVPLEIAAHTSEYSWDKIASDTLKNRITLFEDKGSAEVSPELLSTTLADQLDRLQPDVVAINGWFDRSAHTALLWCLNKQIPAVLMSESSEKDDKRVWWKEMMKKVIVKQFGAAIVGGSRHREYLKKLGLKENQIFIGYDAVDNDYFDNGANIARAERQSLLEKKLLPQNYFLVVSRFIDKKNLFFVIRSYHKYYKKAINNPWHLVILGDGPLSQKLNSLVKELGLTHVIHFDGFKQYDELPVYFGLAKAFIHASTVEQWGLVVNEAMAAGLPVIVSESCGCVPELVHEGVNGFVIDPYNEQALANILCSVSNDPDKLNKMSAASKAIIARFGPDTFGSVLSKAVNYSTNQSVRRRGNKYIIPVLKYLLK